MVLRPTIRHLVVLKTVVEVRNVTKSAALLNSSQPSISRTIKELEGIIGRQLFDRTTRSIIPTNAGRELYNRSVEILSDVDAALASTRDVADGRSGVLKIGYMDFAIVGRLPQILRKFGSQNPRVRLDTQWHMTQDQVHLLSTGELDVGFISGSPNLSGLAKREISRERLFAVFPEDHRLAEQISISLHRGRQLAPLHGSPYRALCAAWLRSTSISNGLHTRRNTRLRSRGCGDNDLS